MQFNVRTLLVGTAFVGLWVGAIMAIPTALGVFAGGRLLAEMGWEVRLAFYPLQLAESAPMWMPIAVVGYSLGQRSLTMKTVVALVVAEALALIATVAAGWLIVWNFTP